MEQLEEDCEAVLFVLYPPRGALFIPSLEIYFFVVKFVLLFERVWE